MKLTPEMIGVLQTKLLALLKFFKQYCDDNELIFFWFWFLSGRHSGTRFYSLG